MNDSHHDLHATPVDRGARRKTKRRGEAIAAIVSLVVIALLAATDVVRSAPADAPVVQATFDAAPPAAETAPNPGLRYERWAADESAQGTRPDGVH